MEKDEGLLAQFGDLLDRHTLGKEWKLDFRTLRDVLGTDTDDAAERAAKEFAMRHGFSLPIRRKLIEAVRSFQVSYHYEQAG